MIPVLPPSAIAQELTACTVLGACTGVVRAVFPVRGRAAWVPDFLWVGTVLTLLQSYAAGQSPAGVLRWYMAAAGFAGAGAAAFVLGVPLRAAGKALQRWVLLPHSGVSGSKMPANYAATQKEPQKSAKRTCQTSAG